MLIHLVKSKIHRARVTQSDKEYEGSITIDANLLDAAGILPLEQVHCLNIDAGTRFITYVLPAEAGSGTICVNGAAARLVETGDKLIILAYCLIDDEQARTYQPRRLLVDENNQIVKVLSVEEP